MAGEEAKKFLEEGNRLLEDGKHLEAVEGYDKALALDPKYAAAWNNRGNALDDLGKYQEAVESYDKALALDPRLAAAWNTRGGILFKLRRYKEALSSYDRACSLKPADPICHYNCAVALHCLGKKAEAADRLRHALRLDPNFREAREGLQHLEAGHPVWWWEWWFGKSWWRRVVGSFLMVLLGAYLLLPVFQAKAVLP